MLKLALVFLCLLFADSSSLKAIKRSQLNPHAVIFANISQVQSLASAIRVACGGDVILDTVEVNQMPGDFLIESNCGKLGSVVLKNLNISNSKLPSLLFEEGTINVDSLELSFVTPPNEFPSLAFIRQILNVTAKKEVSTWQTVDVDATIRKEARKCDGGAGCDAIAKLGAPQLVGWCKHLASEGCQGEIADDEGEKTCLLTGEETDCFFRGKRLADENGKHQLCDPMEEYFFHVKDCALEFDPVLEMIENLGCPASKEKVEGKNFHIRYEGLQEIKKVNFAIQTVHPYRIELEGNMGKLERVDLHRQRSSTLFSQTRLFSMRNIYTDANKPLSINFEFGGPSEIIFENIAPPLKIEERIELQAEYNDINSVVFNNVTLSFVDMKNDVKPLSLLSLTSEKLMEQEKEFDKLWLTNVNFKGAMPKTIFYFPTLAHDVKKNKNVDFARVNDFEMSFVGVPNNAPSKLAIQQLLYAANGVVPSSDVVEGVQAAFNGGDEKACEEMNQALLLKWCIQHVGN